MAWKNLNVRDRAGFIRQMVSLGITKSKDQENFFNSSIEGPGKRQTFNPTKPKYTTQKTVGYQKVPLEGYQLDKYNELMDQQVDNIMNATGADYEIAFKISGYDPYKYVPIKHNFIKKANGGHLFDGDPAAQITLPTVVKGGKPSIFSRGWWGKQADRLDNIAFGAGFIRQMVKLGINTPLEQENSYNYALGGKPRRIYNDKAKEYNHGINNYQQSWAGTYGNNNQPFITEKVYTTGPQWKQQNPSTQVITEEYYNKKYNEGILPIVSAFLGKDPRLEKKVVQKNRYDAYNNPISSVTRTVDYTQPFGQRRTAQRTEFGNSIGPRMNYVQKSLSENSRNIMENQQILNNAQSLIRGYGYGMRADGGSLSETSFENYRPFVLTL